MNYQSGAREYNANLMEWQQQQNVSLAKWNIVWAIEWRALDTKASNATRLPCLIEFGDETVLPVHVRWDSSPDSIDAAAVASDRLRIGSTRRRQRI